MEHVRLFAGAPQTRRHCPDLARTGAERGRADVLGPDTRRVEGRALDDDLAAGQLVDRFLPMRPHLLGERAADLAAAQVAFLAEHGDDLLLQFSQAAATVPAGVKLGGDVGPAGEARRQ
jgi:hypothetical protein